MCVCACARVRVSYTLCPALSNTICVLVFVCIYLLVSPVAKAILYHHCAVCLCQSPGVSLVIVVTHGVLLGESSNTGADIQLEEVTVS